MKHTVTSILIFIYVSSSWTICNVMSYSFSSIVTHSARSGSRTSGIVPTIITHTSHKKWAFHHPHLTQLHMTTQQQQETSDESTSNQSKLPFLLDPGTKGGALFLSLVLFIVPIVGYEITVSMGIMDGVEAGKWIGVGFTVITLLLWAASYVFRVATKDMTYVRCHKS